MQMNKNTMITFQILLLLLTVIAPLVAAQEPEYPMDEYPMVLIGTVTNNDADAGIAEDTIIIARDSETGKDVGSTKVNDNGDFGDQINNKLLVNECNSFDLYIVFGDSKINVGTYTWDNKATSPINIWFSKVTGDTKSGSSGGSSGGSSNYVASSSIGSAESTSTAVAGGAGSELSPDPTLTGTPTLEAEEKKSSLPLAIALLVIILIIVYFGYKKFQ